MGYTSNVAFAVRGSAEHIIVFMAKMRLTLPDVAGSCWENIKTNDNGTIIFFEHNGVKWYDSFPDVQFFELFWDAATEHANDEEENKDGIQLEGSFVRIGENSEDIEERLFGEKPDDLYSVSRVIDRQF